MLNDMKHLHETAVFFQRIIVMLNDVKHLAA